MMAMRYMWSPIDSPRMWLLEVLVVVFVLVLELSMPKRRQPSRGVVFRRSRRWKKGIGEVVEDSGRWVRVVRTGGWVLVWMFDGMD
jgi:hypothetical protein